MNSEQVKNNSTLLYTQAKDKFQEAMEKFEDGTIKSEPAFIRNVFQSFEEFFTSVGKPKMVPRYVVEDGPIFSEDYNKMMKEIKMDLELLFQELNVLGSALYTDFNHNILQSDLTNQKYNNTYDKLRDLQIYSGFGAEGSLRFGRDDFLNTSRIDYERITGKAIEITRNGITLPVKSQKNVSQNAKVTLVKGNHGYQDYVLGSESNGFPGNNSEVTVIADTTISDVDGYAFVGAEDNHGNYGAMIDGDPNTWFEYEKVNLREHEKIRVAKNLGWRYQVHENKTVFFAEDPDNGVLKLHVQIVLDDIETINQINLLMYTPPNYGAAPASIKDILVSDGVHAPVSIMQGINEETNYTFHFDPVEAKVISILFEQDQKYFTDLGHIYYEKKSDIQDGRDYVFDTLGKKYRANYLARVEGPLINLQDLGLKVDSGITDFDAYYPLIGPTQAGYSLNDIVNRLSNGLRSSNVEMGIERFEGWRYCIGIREIEILSCEFEEEAQLVTQPYYFNKPLDKISISSRETIGNMLLNHQGMNNTWIDYYVSINDGATWHPITPIEHQATTESAPKIYTIHSVSEDHEALENKYGYLESSTPIYSLRIKIVLKRPSENDATPYALSSFNHHDYELLSPNLNSFVINVETEEEKHDSEASKLRASAQDFFGDGGSGGSQVPPGWIPPGEGDGSTNTDEDDEIVDPNDPNNEKPGGGNGGNGGGGSGGSGGSGGGGGGIGGGGGGGYPGTGGGGGGGGSGGSGGGGSGGSGGSGSEGEESIKVIISPKQTELCECDSLILTGTITSPNDITGRTLFINNTVIDPFNLGRPTIDPDCSQLDEEESSVEIGMGTKEVTFSWVIPYWKLKELNIDLGGIIIVKVIGEDSEAIDQDEFSLTVDECIESEEIECYELQSVIVSYYNEHFGEIQEMEIAANLFPYEFDSGQGTKVTVSWNSSKNSAVVMITGGYNETGAAFQLNGVGIRYIDYSGQSKLKWGLNVLEESSGVQNSIKMPGNPANKDNQWVSDIQDNGFYGDAPNLGGLNDYIFMVFDNDWLTNACPIDIEFNPEDNEQDPNPPEDPDKEEIYECLDIQRIAFQIYNESTKRLETYQITLNQDYKGTYEVNTGRGKIEVLVGWYNLFTGPLINIQKATGENNLLLSALGVVYRDLFGDLKTLWIEEVKIQTISVKNPSKMVGSLKSLPDLDWIDNDGNPDYSIAPSLGVQGATLVGQVTFDDILCEVDFPVDDNENLPLNDQEPPKIFIDQNIDRICYGDLEDEVLILTGRITDDVGLYEWKITSGGNTWTSDEFQGLVTEDRFEISLNVPFPEPEEGLRPDTSIYLTIEAIDLAGKTVLENYVINIVQCTPPDISDEEDDIENDYDLLFRLRWGTAPSRVDLDFHAFVNGNRSDMVYYGSGKSLEGNHQSDYVHQNGKLYLNADFRDHTAPNAWDTEYEIITIEGFVGDVITIAVKNFTGALNTLDKNPQVEIFDKKTGEILEIIELPPSVFTSRSILVCDINVKENTKLEDIDIRLESTNDL